MKTLIRANSTPSTQNHIKMVYYWVISKGGYHMNLLDDSKLMAIIGAVVKQVGAKMARGDFNLATLIKPV